MHFGPIFGPGRAARSLREGHRTALLRVAHGWTQIDALEEECSGGDATPENAHAGAQTVERIQQGWTYVRA